MKRIETFIVNVLKRLGFVGIGLCAICCLLPVIGAIIGLGSFSAYAIYMEKTGMILVLLAVIAFIYGWYRKKQKRIICENNCECQPKTNQ